MGRLYKPNEFYEVTGISRETLRHYVEKGLLYPAETTEKGYALYGQREVMQMMLLRYYRSCNMTVDEVRDLLWSRDMEHQVWELDRTVESLEEQIRELERQRRNLIRRRQLVYESRENLNRTFFHKEGREMFLLNMEEARQTREGERAIQAMAARFPEGHISLMGRVEDFLARRAMPVELGYGATKRESLEGLDIKLFHRIPAQPALVTRVRVKDPLLLQPEDLRPLYDEVERRGYTVRDGVYGHLLGMEREGESFSYYITMRVHVEI